MEAGRTIAETPRVRGDLPGVSCDVPDMFGEA